MILALLYLWAALTIGLREIDDPIVDYLGWRKFWLFVLIGWWVVPLVAAYEVAKDWWRWSHER